MSLTVTAAQTGAGAFDGLALTVKVVRGQAASPIGATASSGSVTAPELSITPAGTGSYVYGAVYNAAASTAYTAASGTTFSANVSDTTNGVAYGTFRRTSTTTSGTPVTVGATAPTETAGFLGIALLEILAGAGLAEDSSSPAALSTATAETLTTASFTPPAGSILVAQVAANSTGDGTNSMAIAVSDSSGLVWTEQVRESQAVGSATYQCASVWTAVVPSAVAALPASPLMPPGALSPAAWQHPRYPRPGQTVTIAGSGGVAVPKPSLAGSGVQSAPQVTLRPLMPPGALSPAAWQHPPYRRPGQTVTISGSGGIAVPKPSLAGNGFEGVTAFARRPLMPPGLVSPAAWQAPSRLRQGALIVPVTSTGRAGLAALGASGSSPLITPPVFGAAYSPSGDWTSATSPKTQTVTLNTGDVLVLLGGTQNSATTLGTPSGGPASLALAKSLDTSGFCAGYVWTGVTGALAVTTASLPDATAGTAYSQALTAAGGSGGGFTWSVSAGALPSWASLGSSTGVISGTPPSGQTGSTSFTVKVTDSASNAATKSLSLTVDAPVSLQPVGPSGSWTLVFDDEFSGTSLDTTKWTALQGASINNVTTAASNVSVSGGYCILQASSSSSGATINSNPANNGYGSGASGYVMAVGDCVEARVSFPGPSGDSAYDWPAWWVSGGNWPTNGEEDIFESFNGTPSALNYHYSGGANNGPNPSGSWCNSFHTYTLVRGSGTNGLQVWWDGVLMRSLTSSDSGGPQSLMITQGYGAGPNATGAASQILVDYVRAWTPG